MCLFLVLVHYLLLEDTALKMVISLLCNETECIQCLQTPILPGAMLSGCGGLRGSGVLGGVIGACWGIPSTLRPSILTLWMGSPRCVWTQRNSTSGMAFSGEAAPVLQFTAQIWFPACTMLKHTVLLFSRVFPSHLHCLSNQKWAFFRSLDARSYSVPNRAPMLPKGSKNLASLIPLSFKALILQSVSSHISWKFTAFVELLLFGIVFSFICSRNNNFSADHFLEIHDMVLFSTLLLGYRF